MIQSVRISVCIILMSVFTLGSSAQTSGCVSSYSRFGLGLLNEESAGFSRGMGGVGVALPSTKRVNPLNPASYAHIDSMSMIIDAGMHLSTGRMSQGAKRHNAYAAALDYVLLGFRLRKGLGMSLGFMPYSTVSYSFDGDDPNTYRDESTTSEVTASSAFDGEGGMHRAFIGAGWRPFGGLSVGMDASIIWGSITNSVVQSTYVDGSVSSTYSNLNLITDATLVSYRLDFGVQYALRIAPRNVLTIGATTALGHNLGGSSEMLRFTDTGDTLDIECKRPYEIPYTVGFGLAWHRKDNLVVAADGHWEGWSNCLAPVMKSTTSSAVYTARTGQYTDRWKINVGAEWTPDAMSRSFFNHIQYRVGASYSSSYQKINGLTGPDEFSLSAGVGVPIINKINNRSVVNFSMQWVRRHASAASLVNEDYLLFNLGVTFNERWFMKFKIQ